MQRFRFSVGLRIYSIIWLSFCGLIGLAVMQTSNLAASLKLQRQSELSHLAQFALGIAQEEYDAAIRNHSPDELARKTAAPASRSCATATTTISGSTTLDRG